MGALPVNFMPVIDYKSIPKLMLAGEKSIKIAGLQTLNTIAFDSLPKIVRQGEKDLDFRVNARRALGMRVNKARLSQKTMKAEVFTTRGWLAFHTKEGTRRAKSGFKWRGKDYLLIPRKSTKEIAFTKKGRIKASVFKRMYVIPQGDEALVFFRSRGAKQGTLIAWLRTEADYKKDLRYEDAVEREFILKANRLLNMYLDNQIRRNRR